MRNFFDTSAAFKSAVWGDFNSERCWTVSLSSWKVLPLLNLPPYSSQEVTEKKMTKEVKGRAVEKLQFWKFIQGHNRHNLSSIQRTLYFSTKRSQRCFWNVISQLLGMLLKQERTFNKICTPTDNLFQAWPKNRCVISKSDNCVPSIIAPYCF